MAKTKTTSPDQQQATLKSRDKFPALIYIGLAAAILAIYWQVARFKFISLDDPDYITKNRHVLTGLKRENIIWAFTSAHSANWHPLTWISHMVDIQLFGLHPAGHHLMSVLFHMLNTLLLFFVLRKMTGFTWHSVFVAALFAFHPLHVESVAWVAERKDVLSTLFWLLTLCTYVRYSQAPNLKRYLPVAGLLILGLMAKPMLVTLPIVLLILDYWPLARFARVNEAPQEHNKPLAGRKESPKPAGFGPLIWEKIPLFAIAAASCVATFIVQQHGGATRTITQYPLGVRAANAAVAYTDYLINTIWPRRLSVLYPHPGNSIPAGHVIASVLLFVIISLLAIGARRSRPYLTAGWLWYVVTLVPVIGFVQVGQQAMADRYTYVPLIGIFVILAWGIPDLANRFLRSRPSFLAVPAAIVIAVLMVCTWKQISYWQNSITLFDHALEATSDSGMVQVCIADAWSERGRPDMAIRHLTAALKREPDFAEARNSLGFIYLKQGQQAKALDQLKKAIAADPKLASAYNNIGTALLQQGKTDEALRQFSRSVDIKPNNAETQYNLGNALDREGKMNEAAAHYRKALRLNPELAQGHVAMGSVLLRRGHMDAAFDHLQTALKIDPSLVEAHFYLAMVCAKQGNMQDAVRHLTEATKIRPRWGLAHYWLAAALAQQNDYPGAWKEIHLAERSGYKPDSRFVRQLSSKMPEPKQ